MHKTAAMSRALMLSAVLAAVACGNACASIIYDLESDYRSASNPNGAWSYNQGGSALPYYQINWAGVGGNGWTTTPSGTSPPAWLQVQAGTGLPNVAVGDIIVHSTNYSGALANVTWTSPAAGLISLAGQAWDVQHAGGRDDEWSLFLNSTEIAHRGSIVGVAKNSASANFANNLDSGQGLSDLAVNAGDIVKFQVHETQNNYGHFSGVALTVTLTVPDPVSTCGCVGILATLAMMRIRRRG